MRTARERILGRVKDALAGTDRVSCDALFTRRPPGEAVLRDIADPLTEFCRRAHRSGVVLHALARREDLPAACRAQCGSDLALSVSPAQPFDTLAWTVPLSSYSRNSSPAGLVEARLGIAETGTLCFDNRSVPSGLLFLTDLLIVVLETTALVARQEHVWPYLEPSASALHLVTGPSRTADVEQTIQVGAHGPRRVMLFLIGPDAADAVASGTRVGDELVTLVEST